MLAKTQSPTKKRCFVHFELISNSNPLKHDVKLNLNLVAAQSLAPCPLLAEGQFKSVMASEMHLVPMGFPEGEKML